MTHPAGPFPEPTIVVGASRGLGRGIATALAGAGIPVLAVARTAAALAELAQTVPLDTVTADATDPTVARTLLRDRVPETVILVAGATPSVGPLQDHTWESFSLNWQVDVQIAFHWFRELLLAPPAPLRRVIVLSSGAALNGSPLSGGYAGAKSTQRFLARYAQEEADRARAGITVTTVLPRITPLTDLGRPAVVAYAARSGQTEAEYLRPFGPPLTPEIAGRALLQLVQTDPEELVPEYLLSGAGLAPLTAPRPTPAPQPPSARET